MNERLAELEQQVKQIYEKLGMSEESEFTEKDYQINEWEDYHEPLARIFREVKKALPDWRKRISESEDLAEDDIINLLMDKDAEVRLGLAYILVQMVLEIEGKNDIGGMR